MRTPITPPLFSFLVSCSPAVTPTATPPPTATPTPIPTQPPEQVGRLEGVPDPKVTNPKLFDLAKPDAPIRSLSTRWRSEGLEGTPARNNPALIAYTQMQVYNPCRGEAWAKTWSECQS